MVSTDPIADMLSRIRNAIAVGKNEISLPHSKLKQMVADILAENRFIDGVEVEQSELGKKLKITIYQLEQGPAITEISRLSKPGRRWYSSAHDIPIVKRGRGIVVVSTSKGMMTGKQAKSKQLGGELICKVY